MLCFVSLFSFPFTHAHLPLIDTHTQYSNQQRQSSLDDSTESRNVNDPSAICYNLLFFSLSLSLWPFRFESLVPPSVTATNQLVGARQGDINITLECHCESFPKPVVYWLRHSTGDVVVNGNVPNTLIYITTPPPLAISI